MNAQDTRLSARHCARRCLLGSVALAAATVASQAQAATATTNLGVSATVANSCTITATLPVTFGAYDSVVANVASPLDAAGAIATTCTSGASVVITLGQGSNPSDSSSDAVPLREMAASGGSTLRYFLYSDSGRQTVWGNTAGTGKADTGTGASHELQVYGRVTAGQNVPSGSYSDTVIATVTF